MKATRADREAVDRLIAQLAGEVGDFPGPGDLAGWIVLARRRGLTVRGAYRPGKDFTARLVEERAGEYAAVYNSARSVREKVRFVAHELAEYLQVVADSQLRLLSDLHEPHYDGAEFPHDVRHLRAVLFTDRLAPKPAKRLPARPQPFDWARYTRPRAEIEYVSADAFDTQDWPAIGRCTE